MMRLRVTMGRQTLDACLIHLGTSVMLRAREPSASAGAHVHGASDDGGNDDAQAVAGPAEGANALDVRVAARAGDAQEQRVADAL